MDDLEFRRRVYADPRLRDPELAREARATPQRARFAAEVARLEREIAAALQIEVPAGLADRIVLRRSLDAQRSRQAEDGIGFERRLTAALEVEVPRGLTARILLRRGIEAQRRRRRIWRSASSLAAGIVVASWLVLALWPQSQSLEASVLSHVHHELEKLSVDRTVGIEDLQRVISRSGADVIGELGEVRYAGLCPMRREQGAHLVLAGARGPVTVFLMPGEEVDGPTVLADERFVGRIVPTANGSMAIVGESGEPLEPMERRLRAGLHFRS